MTILVLAPVFEEVEDREDLAVRVLLEMAENSDVAPIANLFAEVGGVEDVFRLEVGVSLAGSEEAEIQLEAEIAHRLVQEAGMTCFIPCHVGKALGQQRVLLLDPAAQFLVEEEA